MPGSVTDTHHMSFMDSIRHQIRERRFLLLLIASLLVLLIPGFFDSSSLSDLLFFACLSFLFIQSMVVATQSGSKSKKFRFLVVLLLIIVTWLEPAGLDTSFVMELRLIAMILFFSFVSYSLVRFLTQYGKVNSNMLLAAINIYLIMGIVAGYLAQLFYVLDPNAFSFPDYIGTPRFTDFIYYSFISMATVGYGDIVPATRQAQTLSYFIAIIGQLYLAIIIAIIVGKYASSNKSLRKSKENNSDL